MINLNQTSKYDLSIVLFAIILVQLVLGFQGFDICDDGFALTFYQQIYNDSSSVEYSFVYWLSGVVGGLWYQLYPNGGILWFKIFTVIINTATFVAGYYLFKQLLPKRIVILGLLITLFVNDFGFLVYYHNHLTALLAIVSVIFLMKGLIKNSAVAIMISGCIIGINVFTRLPNLTLLSFVLAIPFYYLINKKELKHSIKPILIYVLGVMLGFVLILLLLLVLGQFDIMKNAIISLFDLGATKDSSHNVGGLLKTYYINYKILFTVIAELILITTLFFAVFSFLKKQVWLRNILFLIGFYFVFKWFNNGNIFTVYAISYVGVFLVLFTKQSSAIKTVAFLGFLMLTFLPLGSGGAIVSSGYMCIWLAVPFFFYFLNGLKDATFSLKAHNKIKSIIIPQKISAFFLLFITIAFFSAKALNVSKHAYFDDGSRLKKTYTIKSDLAKGIYTTQRRAEITNGLLINLEKYVEPNDYLLTYDKIPMVHFLTKTRPYMYNSWVWIYDSNSFEKKLKQAEKEIKIYPVIVIQKFETIRAFSEPIPNYMAEDLTNTKGTINAYDAKKNTLMNNFLDRNEYEIVWSNAFFNILKTEKTHE